MNRNDTRDFHCKSDQFVRFAEFKSGSQSVLRCQKSRFALLTCNCKTQFKISLKIVGDLDRSLRELCLSFRFLDVYLYDISYRHTNLFMQMQLGREPTL